VQKSSKKNFFPKKNFFFEFFFSENFEIFCIKITSKTLTPRNRDEKHQKKLILGRLYQKSPSSYIGAPGPGLFISHPAPAKFVTRSFAKSGHPSARTLTVQSDMPVRHQTDTDALSIAVVSRPSGCNEATRWKQTVR
jgi:hypothetical protein